jgi:hypothetical protein
MDAPIMPLLDITAWAACQSAEASPDATARRIGTHPYVDDATYFSIDRARKSGRLFLQSHSIRHEAEGKKMRISKEE